MKSLLSVLIIVFLICNLLYADNSSSKKGQIAESEQWPILKHYDAQHLRRIALPIGGIGTGTVSLGGRGDLRDWEIMNRPVKGLNPTVGWIGAFFAVCVDNGKSKNETRALTGPVNPVDYQGSHGSRIINSGLPTFKNASFAAAYPFGQVFLTDTDMPIDVTIKAFNPLIPADADASGIPIAVLRYLVKNKTKKNITVSICGNIPNFIGIDALEQNECNVKPYGTVKNRNQFRKTENIQGILMTSDGVPTDNRAAGTIALTTTEKENITYRTNWLPAKWGTAHLDFWDDFSEEGKIEERKGDKNRPIASLNAKVEIPKLQTKEITFLITWHFPNRQTWTPKKAGEDNIGNYYTTKYEDAWDVAEKTVPRLDDLEQKTLLFVRTFCQSTLPAVVKEAALFNISTLRTQTCFRTPDGRFFGFEGSTDCKGCCLGSCTHVWNYEQATPFLFGNLAKTMREVEFAHATDANGLMSFRVHLPLSHAQDYPKAAADGQMGCIMKIYRDWQLSGDDEMLKSLWPHVKRALEFAWIKGGWDGDKDGVMEGCQHNTMDVEYYGPNPQMGFWYLAALRAAEEMSRYLGEDDFAGTCRSLFDNGSKYLDSQLFNGQYYEQIIQPPKDSSEIAPALLIGAGAIDPTKPDYQLGTACLVDQLVGQFAAHVCNLGYLAKPQNIRAALKTIEKYNLKESLHDHFNCLRSFALGDESALLMASYPKGDRPKNPFPYFTETMTGFEYTAAVGMLYEGQLNAGLKCIKNIRDRYDGLKRSPFNEAECGHHYARAMASWASVLALTGFGYSGVEKTMYFAPREGTFFFSNGYAWGNCRITRKNKNNFSVELSIHHGRIQLEKFILRGFSSHIFKTPLILTADQKTTFNVKK